ncbi:hypothetical protein ACT3UD_01845 [Glutamicibacter sp. 287]|uniref:hypothetical protein n=1 Tax=unclassified Glutamicibacter TaxID=2627139 RepID=UPI00159686A0|nr:hypothetical protein [Glutamicibacter sp. BW80]
MHSTRFLLADRAAFEFVASPRGWNSHGPANRQDPIASGADRQPDNSERAAAK